MTEDPDWFEREQLHFAAADGDVERMKALVASGFQVDAFDELGFTPLHHAVKTEHLAAIEYLISVGANVNSRDETRIGNSPLAEVAATCSLAVARLLIDAGADPSLPGWMQLSALDLAERRKRGDGPAVYALLTRASSRERA
ncbi:MAG: ankyrin repeat domain-containing protein [Thermoanaerobaculia bacterium]